jgi:polyisoprenoid-binding protein YceI
MVQGQPVYRMSQAHGLSMKLSGTSTLHNWTMNADAFTGLAQFNFKPGAGGQLASIKNLNFSLPVQNLKSDEKKLDENAYKALKTEQHKDISYRLTSSAVSPMKNNRYDIKTRGNLSIAGVTRVVDMNVSCAVNSDASITCTGSKKMKMSEYNVQPPKFMMGAMKTGDAITLEYTLVYRK